MSPVGYSRSESRDVRPFFEAVTLERVLAGATLQLFEGSGFVDAPVFTVEERDLDRLALTVRPNLTATMLDAGAVSRRKLILVVTASNPFLKRTFVAAKIPLRSTPPETVTLDAETLERLGGGAHLDVDVALCLAERATRRPGQPFLRGHWLARKSFALRPPKLSEDFEVEPLDDEGWKAMGLPPKTLYHVEYYGGFNEPVSRDRPIAKVRLHADAYRKLAGEALPKASRPFMAFLTAEISSQLVAASLSDWKDSDRAEPRSPLAVFLKRVDKVQPCSLEDLRRMVEEPGMSRLRAILHADQETTRRLVEG